MKQVSREAEDNCHLLSQASSNVPAEAPVVKNMVNVVLLLVAAILYGTSVGGAVEVLGSFVMKEPLSWNAMQVTFCPLCIYVLRYFICNIDARMTTGFCCFKIALKRL